MKKESVQTVGVLVAAVIIGVGAMLLINAQHTKRAQIAHTGDVTVGTGDLKVVPATPDGTTQSNTLPGQTGIASQTVNPNATTNNGSLQTTGQLEQPQSSSLQGQ